MPLTPTPLTIPTDLNFSDLNLKREPDGRITFKWEPIEKICLESNVSIDLFRNSPEHNISELLQQWYKIHIQNGGKPDAVVEDLAAEADYEDSRGYGFSHRPGRA